MDARPAAIDASVLGQLVDEARRAWPTLHVAPDKFLSYLAERSASAESLRVADLYLACGCAYGDTTAIELFERHYFGDISLYVGGVDAALVEEARQTLRIRLLVGHDGKPPQIVKYLGTGALGGWLRMACVRVVRDLQRSQKRHQPLPQGRDVGPPIKDAEIDFLKQRYAKELGAVFTEVLRALPAEERNILALRYIDGLSTDAVAAVLSLDGSTARRRLAKLRKRILDDTRAMLADQLRLGDSECDSLIALMRSQIAVSVLRHLR